METYCLKCKKNTELQNPELKTNKKGGKYLSGVCPCGCKKCKIVKKDFVLENVDKKLEDD